MEETLEEKVPAAVKVPDDDQGGTGRRLRDRDLLRKRKAEAEARAINQWVYGAQSSKRAKRETNNVPRKKGRPKKNVPEEPQPESIEAQDTGEIEALSQAEEIVTAPYSAPVPTLESASIPDPMSAPDLEHPQVPGVVSVPIPSSDVTPEIKPSSDALLQEVLFEDLSPDGEEDKEVPQDKLVIDQGGVEEPSAVDIDEQNKVFSDTVLVSPQPGSLPGNLI